MRRSSRSAQSRTLASLLLAALVLFGNLASAVHFMTVRHVACPEHGELEHARLPRDPGLARHRDEPSGPTLRNAQAGAAEGHGHCCLAIVKRDWLRSDAAPHVRGYPEREQVTLRTGSEHAHEQLARHLLAPKQSPPA